MATPTTVTYGLDTPAALPRAGVIVTAELVGAGDRSDDVGVVGGTVSVTTGVDGVFTLSLLPNSVYEQLDTYYAVNITGGPSYNIVVPVSGSAVDLWDIRVDPRTLDPVEPSVPPIYLMRAERGAVNGVAGLGADGKVPSAQLPVGGGSVPDTRQVLTGGLLTGGGDLSADRTITSPPFGSTAGTICQGNDGRFAALQTAVDGKEATGTAAAAVAAHVAAVDPHPQYLTAAEGNAAYDALGAGTTAAAAAIATHLAAGDPHPQYLTAAEGNAAYDAIGAAAAAVAAHKIESDAHAISVITGLQTALDAKANKPRFAALVKTDGNIQLNTGTNTWGLLTGAPTLAIAAAAGDLIELSVQQLRQANANIFLDWCVIVSAAPVRYMGTLSGTPAGEGNPALYHTNLPSAGGVWKWLAQPGDISGGNVTVGIAIRNTSGASSLLLASTDNPLQIALENKGATAA